MLEGCRICSGVLDLSGQPHATLVVVIPGLCQPRVTPAPGAWGSASQTLPSSTYYIHRSFVINLLIDGPS